MNELKYIKQYCEKTYNIKDISKVSRKTNYVQARALYYSLSRKHTSYSTTVIGEQLKKDHSTVVHGSNKLHDELIDSCYFYKKCFETFKKEGLDNLQEFKNVNIESESKLKYINVIQKTEIKKLNNKIDSLKNKIQLQQNGDLVYLISRFDKLTEDKQQQFLVRTDAMLKMMK